MADTQPLSEQMQQLLADPIARRAMTPAQLRAIGAALDMAARVEAAPVGTTAGGLVRKAGENEQWIDGVPTVTNGKRVALVPVEVGE
jgi:hypothetical protein